MAAIPGRWHLYKVRYASVPIGRPFQSRWANGTGHQFHIVSKERNDETEDFKTKESQKIHCAIGHACIGPGDTIGIALGRIYPA